MLRPRAKQQAPCQRCSQHSSQLRFGGRVTFPVLHHATSALMQKTSRFLGSWLFAIARRRIARDVGIIAPERAQRGLSGKPSAEFPKTLCSFQQPEARAAHWRPARAQQPATSNTYVAPNRAPPGGRKPTGVSPGRLGLRCAALAGICGLAPLTCGRGHLPLVVGFFALVLARHASRSLHIAALPSRTAPHGARSRPRA